MALILEFFSLNKTSNEEKTGLVLVLRRIKSSAISYIITQYLKGF